jgi:GDP-L-fucose synthase
MAEKAEFSERRGQYRRLFVRGAQGVPAVEKGNYLITGATGLMGTIALKRLGNLPGINIKAVYHRKEPFVFADNITYVRADLTSAETCGEIVKGCDYILSFAGILMTAPVLAADPVSPVTKNIRMMALLLDAAYSACVKKFLCISSSTGYPDREVPLHEEDMFLSDPAEAYYSVGWMFRYIETLCRMYATKLKSPMTVAVIRPSTIYGEYEDFSPENSHMLPALVRKIADRENPIQIWGSGEVKRDLIYAGDLFEACIRILEETQGFDVFNIAFGKEYSINELLDMIIHIDNYADAHVVYKENRPVTGGRRILDTNKVREQFGFFPMTDIKTGIKKMLQRYKKLHFSAARR